MFLDATHHIHNSLVDLRQVAFRQRAGIAPLNVFDHGALAVGLVNGQAGMALQPSNFDGRRRTLVKQRCQLAVQFVDFLAPTRNIHNCRLRVRSYEQRAMSDLVNSATVAASRPGFCSMRRTIALPTTAPSANLPTSANCAGVEIPKPTAIGSLVKRRM